MTTFRSENVDASVSYVSPVDGKQIYRIVKVNYDITIESLGSNKVKWQNNVTFDIGPNAEQFTVIGTGLVHKKCGKTVYNLIGSGTWNSTISGFGPEAEFKFIVNQDLTASLEKCCKLKFTNNEHGFSFYGKVGELVVPDPFLPYTTVAEGVAKRV